MVRYSSRVFRISKLTDYGIVLLAHLARDPERSTHNAREVASEVELPVPVVSKILKSLTRQGLLESHRGVKGGYSLTRPPEQLSVAEMISALEGPVALTECYVAEALCRHEGSCAVRAPWQRINRAVEEALHVVTLADLIDPAFPAASAPHALPRLELDQR